ncbi:uncharacterized protein LOC131478816 [Ochotona princeps]|uniref:uncharacterized protein LOC131478816 n=1 Tax=Ochotona princeps TaxID=9978 RepID=UPI002714A3AA|nr:uncharacterized protein LOC131478816 [Ochotona princeps]
MKLLALFVARCAVGCESPVIFLSYAFDLSSYAFYQRGTVKEACKFLARLAIPRVSPTAREIITHEGSMAFVRRYLDSLAVVAITDEAYPPRLFLRERRLYVIRFFREYEVLTLCRAVVIEESTVTSSYRTGDPRGMDQTTVALEKAENAQVEVRRTIDAILRNGEDLNELVQKSDDLSLASKQLFKSAKEGS